MGAGVDKMTKAGTGPGIRRKKLKPVFLKTCGPSADNSPARVWPVHYSPGVPLSAVTRPRSRQEDSIKEVTMLVLSRKLNEKIVINGDITVTIVKIDRNQVRIGIEAPGHVPVYREEIMPLARVAADREALAVMA